MKEVKVMSRARAVQLTPDKDTCFISIWAVARPMIGPYMSSPPMDGWKATLKVEFDDATKPILGYPHLILFNEDMAEEIVDFIKLYDDNPFIVHCDAGYSRSAAIGSFLAEAFNYNAVYCETGSVGDGTRNVLISSLLKRVYYKRMGYLK